MFAAEMRSAEGEGTPGPGEPMVPAEEDPPEELTEIEDVNAIQVEAAPRPRTVTPPPVPLRRQGSSLAVRARATAEPGPPSRPSATEAADHEALLQAALERLKNAQAALASLAVATQAASAARAPRRA